MNRYRPARIDSSIDCSSGLPMPAGCAMTISVARAITGTSAVSEEGYGFSGIDEWLADFERDVMNWSDS